MGSGLDTANTFLAFYALCVYSAGLAQLALALLFYEASSAQ